MDSKPPKFSTGIIPKIHQTYLCLFVHFFGFVDNLSSPALKENPSLRQTEDFVRGRHMLFQSPSSTWRKIPLNKHNARCLVHYEFPVCPSTKKQSTSSTIHTWWPDLYKKPGHRKKYPKINNMTFFSVYEEGMWGGILKHQMRDSL